MKQLLSGDQLPGLVFLAMPAVVVGRALRPWNAPGLGTEMLFSNLFAGAQVRRWFGGGGWSGADLALHAGHWWPENLTGALWQALVGSWFDAGVTHGLLLAVAATLAGYGPFRLVRAWWPSAPLSGAVTAGLLVQISPPVLRAAWSGEIGVLGVGLVALALAQRRAGWAAALALLAGGWSAAAAVTVVIAGIARRRAVFAVAAVPLALALASPPSALPGAARLSPRLTGTGTGYISETMAVLPLPPDEQADVTGAPPTRSPSVPDEDAPLSPARLPGGLGIWAAALLGLAVGRRAPAAVGLVLLLGWTGLFGLLPVSGQPPPVPAQWLIDLGPWVPGLRPPVGSLSWMLPALLAASIAIVEVPRPLLLVAIGLGAALLENPRLSLPVTGVAPEPVLGTVRGLPEGAVALFPSPVMPWRQGQRNVAELLFKAGRPGHPLDIGIGPPGDAALMGALSRHADQPVDLAAGPWLWQAREADPFESARAAGFTALLVDAEALDEETMERVDGWLTAHVGMAIARDARWAVYDLADVAERGAPSDAPSGHPMLEPGPQPGPQPGPPKAATDPPR